MSEFDFDQMFTIYILNSKQFCIYLNKTALFSPTVLSARPAKIFQFCLLVVDLTPCFSMICISYVLVKNVQKQKTNDQLVIINVLDD